MRTKAAFPVLACALAALGMAACEGDLSSSADEAQTLALSVARLEWTGPMPSPLLGGLTVAVNVRAVDAAGKPVAGVPLQFSAAAGHGTFDGANAQATTDTAGIARSRWTLGMAGGQQQATAQVVGGIVHQTLTLPVAPGNPDAPRFATHSISLAGPLCASEGQMASGRAQFSLLAGGGDVLQLATVQPRTGTSSGLYVGFIGRAPGVARIEAQDPYGRGDTLTVTVGAALPTVTLRDTIQVAAGDSAFTGIAVGGACAASLNNSFISSLFHTDSTQNRATSLATDVFAARRRAPGPGVPPGIQILGLKPGSGSLVVRFWGGVDTATVVVR